VRGQHEGGEEAESVHAEQDDRDWAGGAAISSEPAGGGRGVEEGANHGTVGGQHGSFGFVSVAEGDEVRAACDLGGEDANQGVGG